MVRTGRERLRGTVQVDETVLGAPEARRHGRGALGKATGEITVEQDGHGRARCRMQIIENATTATLREFLLAHIEPGTTVISDGLNSLTQTVLSSRQ